MIPHIHVLDSLGHRFEFASCRFVLDEAGNEKGPPEWAFFISDWRRERLLRASMRFAHWVATSHCEAAIKFAPGEFVEPSRLEGSLSSLSVFK